MQLKSKQKVANTPESSAYTKLNPIKSSKANFAKAKKLAKKGNSAKLPV